MAIDLIKKLIRSGIHVAPPPSIPPSGGGMQLRPPPFYGTSPSAEERGD